MPRRRHLLLVVAALALVALMAPGVGFGVVWRVYGPSMEPTITDGSLVLVDPVQPQVVGYQRGDIVILTPPGHSDEFPFGTMIKRVVAVPGERVAIGDGVVTVDGRVLDEPYLPAGGAGLWATESFVETIVPAGTVFVLGDHRDNSLDSLMFGAVPIDQLHGRVLLIVGGGGVAAPTASPLPGTAAADY